MDLALKSANLKENGKFFMASPGEPKTAHQSNDKKMTLRDFGEMEKSPTTMREKKPISTHLIGSQNISSSMPSIRLNVHSSHNKINEVARPQKFQQLRPAHHPQYYQTAKTISSGVINSPGRTSGDKQVIKTQPVIRDSLHVYVQLLKELSTSILLLNIYSRELVQIFHDIDGQ